MNPQHLAQQIIANCQTNTGQIVNTPPARKPIFVMRFRSSVSDSEFETTKQYVWKSDMAKEYHLILLRNDKDKDEFEMYNSDRIETQRWNELVNRILK